MPEAPTPSVDFVRRCLEQLARLGFARVVTGALAPSEQGGFLAAGFEVTEHLHLLGRDLGHVPDRRSWPRPDLPGLRLRRGRGTDRGAVLDVDHMAFSPFWRLDGAGLDEALAATPRSRFRVARHARGLAGYAVTGRSGGRGFLQRLAVEPGTQGRGLGRLLVLDALHWLHRWGVERVVVNTQLDNGRALRLYEDLGFRREPVGLSVLAVGLDW
jgi:ribosomal protein S18 acetylase RimI-like enzyme